ncbi:MAG: zinc ribbon domain-containing protein [Acidobacteria bacterium]|nr:zinc ribbon domain-containing protein [Acidobacteriota bacterium]
MEASNFLKRMFLLLLSIPFFFLGLIFLISAFHPEAISQGKMGIRIFFGALLAFAGIVFLVLAFIPFGGKNQKESSTLFSGQEPPGKLNVKPINCPHCGAQVDPSTTTLSPEGTLTMKCPYCGGMFLIEEAPKW